jgi:hypothetical protein
VAKLMQYYCDTNPDAPTCIAGLQALCRNHWNPNDCPLTGGDWFVIIVACGFLLASGFYLVVRFFEWIDARMEAELSDTDSLPAVLQLDDASTATVETLAYSGDGNDDAWSACGTEAGEEE